MPLTHSLRIGNQNKGSSHVVGMNRAAGEEENKIANSGILWPFSPVGGEGRVSCVSIKEKAAQETNKRWIEQKRTELRHGIA